MALQTVSMSGEELVSGLGWGIESIDDLGLQHNTYSRCVQNRRTLRPLAGWVH